MPPRWMQSKLIKIAKSKRKAYYKKGRSGGVDAGKVATHEVFQHRSRVNTIAGRSNALPILDNTWTKEIPKTISRPEDAFTKKEVEYRTYERDEAKGKWVTVFKTKTEYGPSHQSILHKQRQVAKKERDCLLDKLYSFWQGKETTHSRQGFAAWHKVAMRGNLFLYFSGNEFIFVLEGDKKRFVSMTYEGRDAATKAFESDRISWLYEDK